DLDAARKLRRLGCNRWRSRGRDRTPNLDGDSPKPSSCRACRKSAPQCRKNTLAWQRHSAIRVHATVILHPYLPRRVIDDRAFGSRDPAGRGQPERCGADPARPQGPQSRESGVRRPRRGRGAGILLRRAWPSAARFRGHAALIERELRRAGIRGATRRVDSEPAYREALQTFAPDIILTDHSLPTFGAADALRIALLEAPDTPVIVVTGSLDEETAAEYIKA